MQCHAELLVLSSPNVSAFAASETSKSSSHVYLKGLETGSRIGIKSLEAVSFCLLSGRLGGMLEMPVSWEIVAL